MNKALELWRRSGVLGFAEAYNIIGSVYYNGEGVQQDEKKATHYFEQAAMEGSVQARHNLGVYEEEVGNMDRSLRHHVIAAGAGDNDSLKKIQELYSEGHATKEDYTKALRSYQEYLGEIKSKQRDRAAAEFENCQYY